MRKTNLLKILKDLGILYGELNSLIVEYDTIDEEKEIKEKLGIIIGKMKKIKCVFIGEPNTGKTCCLISYTSHGFPGEFIPRIMDTCNVNLIAFGRPIILEIQDTAGLETYYSLGSRYKHCDIFLLCFSIISPQSLDNLQSRWLPHIQRLYPGVPVLLVGTKIDLRNDKEAISHLGLQPISQDKIQEKMKEMGTTNYVECSAFTQEGLHNVFDEAIRVTALHALQRSKNACIVS